MLDTCTLAVLAEMNSSAPISRLLRPAAIRRSTSRSRGVRADSAAPVPSGAPAAGGRAGLGRAPVAGERGPAGQAGQGRPQRRGSKPVRGGRGLIPLLL